MTEIRETAAGADSRIPHHVAVIMDGNGRWAQKHGVSRLAGHNAGMLAMKEIIKRADVMGIRYLTVYAFSTENWKRSQEEVGGIFSLLVKYVGSELAELNENNVRVRILGDWSRLPAPARASIEKALAVTADNDGLQFSIALNYGGRQEILRAVRNLCARAASGEIEAAAVTEEMISDALYTGKENGCIPDPDLIIRTSGEERLSNFLLWQCAYSELAFTDSLWPDFTPDEFETMVKAFGNRKRRFGGR
ncbi:MAG: isoprenyl transferase [Firmicutes bacterium]|nr:isoprenyl transferase [Bacillota bacterium]